MGNYFYNFGNWFITKINKFISLSAYSVLILRTIFLRKKGIHRTSLSMLFRQVLFKDNIAFRFKPSNLKMSDKIYRWLVI